MSAVQVHAAKAAYPVVKMLRTDRMQCTERVQCTEVLIFVILA